MIKEQAEYTQCDNCGASILKQYAIEDEGKTLCSECVVKITNKDVAKAEKIAADLKLAEYEAQKTAVVKQQSKRAIVVLIICIGLFFTVQWVMQMNKPEPVKTVTINYTKNIYAAKALINIGLNDYSANNNKLPTKLQQLYPKYLPTGVDRAFNQLNYQKINENSYSLDIIVPPSSAQQSGVTDDHKKAK